MPQPVRVQGVQGGDDSLLSPVRGVIGRGRAAVPPGSRQGTDDLGRSAEGGEARVDPVRSDGNLHPAQGQIQALDPGGLGSDVVGDIARGLWSGAQNRHVHEDVPGVTHGEAHVLRAARPGVPGLSRQRLTGARRAPGDHDGGGENGGGEESRTS